MQDSNKTKKNSLLPGDGTVHEQPVRDLHDSGANKKSQKRRTGSALLTNPKKSSRSRITKPP